MEPVSDLLPRFRAAADPSGFLPFDRFMELALYAEGGGFYSRPTPPFGAGGDYYTAPAVHPLFGATVAARVSEVIAALGGDQPRRIVEIGPGDGTLAGAVLRALGQGEARFPDLEYVLVERSTTLEALAVDRARAASVESGIPVRAGTALSTEGPVVGVVLANELLDAQPARRLEWDGNAWHELGVRVSGSALISAKGPARPVPGPPLPTGVAPGTVVEVSPVAEAIVREIADHLVGGVAIVLDYGAEEPELLAAHPRGTLQSVAGHRWRDDPLASPGSSDLSVFVNFTRVRSVARTSGLVEIADRSQAEALGAWGFADLLARAVSASRSPEEEVRTRLAAKNLLFGFEQFRALELTPGAVRSPGAAGSS